MAPQKADKSLAWTDDDAAARLLARDPMALLIGFLLDQQVPMEWAFGAPETLRRRIGGKLDPKKIAAMDEMALVEAFVAKPPLHRYPASMARRTRTMAQRIVDDYGGDAAKIWTTAADASEVSRRIAKLPGFSANKARVIIGSLAKRLAVPIPGWEGYSPDWFSLADVDSKEALLKYRGLKRAAKASGNWPPAEGQSQEGTCEESARRKGDGESAGEEGGRGSVILPQVRPHQHLAEQDHQLDLHRHSQRQLGDPHRAASATAGIAESVDQKLRRRVHHHVLLRAAGGAGDVTQQAHHAHDSAQGPRLRAHRGKRVDYRNARRRLGLLDAYIGTDLAGMGQGAISNGHRS